MDTSHRLRSCTASPSDDVINISAVARHQQIGLIYSISTDMHKEVNKGGQHASGRSRVRLITTRMGRCPPSRRVVSRGLSRRTVLPPTMTASATARCANTLCRDCELLTQAAWPVGVAILPSSVMAYLSVDIGTPKTARCNRACTTISHVGVSIPAE